MSYITGWVVQIVLFIMLAMIIDMLIPNGSMRKYVKLTAGLLLISIILMPVFNLMKMDMGDLLSAMPASEETFLPLEDQTNKKKRDIENAQTAYILEQMAVQLKEQAEKELMDQYGLAVSNIQIKSKGTSAEILDNLEKVAVTVTEKQPGEVDEVEQVSIDISGKRSAAGEKSADNIAAFLSKQWDIPESVIEIVDEEGNRT